MIDFNDVCAGITTRCNAKCEFCFHTMGVRFDKGIIDLDLYKILVPLIPRTNELILCGNLGDPILHPDFMNFVRMCRAEYPELKIAIATNASIVNDSMWEELGSLSSNKMKITFGIDGLKDTHHKYRGTNFDSVFNNLKLYVSNGGNAIWQAIVFRYNYHQIDEMRSLAKQIGCKEYLVKRSDVYSEDEIDLTAPPEMISRNDLMDKIKGKPITCDWKTRKIIYISEYGELQPCCHISPYLNLKVYDDIRELYFEHKDSLNLYKYDIDTVAESPFIQYVNENMNNIQRCKNICGFNYKLFRYVRMYKHEIFSCIE